MKTSSLLALLMIVVFMSACETRSKLVAENIYGRDKSEIAKQCLESIQSVEKRQLIKNSSFFALPMSAVLTGGLSLITVAVANAGITLDDEVNANRIAKACGLREHLKENTDIALTMASNSAVSAITGTANFASVPLQKGME